MVLIANGARSGFLPEVPPANLAKCMAALQKLIDGESAGTDAKRVDDDFSEIREKAYGTRERPKTPQRLDPREIYARWNNPPSAED
ncbi:hypothetical protein IVB30_02065 [Bradyrhizobium sp. 200]|uniref:hypothetical protein n=1 Tax=Bradyrhizobium sp. 200 TaxID=2782665 RepID=UPI001FFFF6B9|nr:hypothetical protein [Bradyrhizobium sp. 200]UPJ50243.1 hypothetical protein IVB30_02065 [Bradyrhizobium sp. 200]